MQCVVVKNKRDMYSLVKYCFCGCSQEDVLLKCFELLEVEDLKCSEQTCKRFLNVIAEGDAWGRKCADIVPEINDVIHDVETDELLKNVQDASFESSEDTGARSADDLTSKGLAAISLTHNSNHLNSKARRMALKRLCSILMREDSEFSLIAEAVRFDDCCMLVFIFFAGCKGAYIL